VQQPAVTIVRLREAQCEFGTSGIGTVAIVDDRGSTRRTARVRQRREVGLRLHTQHAGRGRDRRRGAGVGGASGRGPGSTRSTRRAPRCSTRNPPRCWTTPRMRAFGHGTMVAGVSAPGRADRRDHAAQGVQRGRHRLPLRHPARALLRDPEERGRDQHELQPGRPLRRAEARPRAGHDGRRRRGVLRRTDGQQVLRWPAALDNVVGVASTSNQDTRSSFSNYGSDSCGWPPPARASSRPIRGGRMPRRGARRSALPSCPERRRCSRVRTARSARARPRRQLAQAEPVSSELNHGRPWTSYRAVDMGRVLWPNHRQHGPGPRQLVSGGAVKALAAPR
jgi:hypothetical protein